MPRQKYATLVDRLNADMDKDGDCWLWTGFATRGYGMFSFHGRQHYAHRAAYECFVGPIPEGSYVMHKCDTPGCCNPAHLTLGTSRDNALDMARKRRAANQFNLSDDDVLLIRSSREPARVVAGRLGISMNVVHKIRSGRSWLHVADTRG